jgi:hypothetical protein
MLSLARLANSDLDQKDQNQNRHDQNQNATWAHLHTLALADVHMGSYRGALVAYELEREENIRRNREVLIRLGLDAPLVPPVEEPPQPVALSEAQQMAKAAKKAAIKEENARKGHERNLRRNPRPNYTSDGSADNLLAIAEQKIFIPLQEEKAERRAENEALRERVIAEAKASSSTGPSTERLGPVWWSAAVPNLTSMIPTTEPMRDIQISDFPPLLIGESGLGKNMANHWSDANGKYSFQSVHRVGGVIKGIKVQTQGNGLDIKQFYVDINAAEVGALLMAAAFVDNRLNSREKLYEWAFFMMTMNEIKSNVWVRKWLEEVNLSHYPPKTTGGRDKGDKEYTLEERPESKRHAKLKLIRLMGEEAEKDLISEDDSALPPHNDSSDDNIAGPASHSDVDSLSAVGSADLEGMYPGEGDGSDGFDGFEVDVMDSDDDDGDEWQSIEGPFEAHREGDTLFYSVTLRSDPLLVSGAEIRFRYPYRTETVTLRGDQSASDGTRIVVLPLDDEDRSRELWFSGLQVRAPPPPASVPEVPDGIWLCECCTLFNDDSRNTCSVCRTRRGHPCRGDARADAPVRDNPAKRATSRRATSRPVPTASDEGAYRVCGVCGTRTMDENAVFCENTNCRLSLNIHGVWSWPDVRGKRRRS